MDKLTGEDLESVDKKTSEAKSDAVQTARFAVEWDFPRASDNLLTSAQAAVHHEYLDCSKWKRLKCHNVSLFAEQKRGTIYLVHLGGSVEFDWTWEGAIAFKPRSLETGEQLLSQFEIDQPQWDDEILWSGEIVEVDERNGCLFISLSDPERRPTIGEFYVRPFEFLSVLDTIYNSPRFERIRDDFPSRLAAAQGQIQPSKTDFQLQHSDQSANDLPFDWQHSWSVLWGPPGTGKTFTTGQQIAAVMAQAEMSNQEERILVVSTTNRATDSVAIALGNAARKKCSTMLEAGQFSRIGKGASFQSFDASSLNVMLQGTESSTLVEIDELAKKLPLFESWEDKALTRKQIGELRSQANDRSRHIFVNPNFKVVVSTAFKAMSLLNLETIRKQIETGEAPFTTIMIDEAGLMSRAAIAALSLLASRRVVLVGDSKQLAPISRISRILPSSQQTWLASSGLSHLDDLATTPESVHILSEQRRMHPDVCRVVSEFQYGGRLTTAPEIIDRPSGLPKLLADQPRAIWYVLDEEDCELASIRAQRGPGNRSWIRTVTQNVLVKLFSDSSMRESRGLFISPYKAQAKAISNQLSQWGLDRWEASTVHSQQGHEADIVIFDTVNAGSCNWPHEEWKRLVNVALSRARESVIVLASRSEMAEPYLSPLTESLSPQVLIQQGNVVRWEPVAAVGNSSRRSFKLEKGRTEQVAVRENTLGYQIKKRKRLRPVLSREQQQLSNLSLDGKPRLVRGVAGSGKSIVLSHWLARTVKRLETVRDDSESPTRVWAVYGNRSLHKLLRESIESAWRNENPLYPFPWKLVELFHIQDVLSWLLPSVELALPTFQFDYDKAAEEFLARHDASELLPRCSALFVDEAQDMGPHTLRLLLSLVQQTDPQDDNSRSANIFYDNDQNVYGRATPTWSEFGLDLRGRSTIMKESFRSTRPISELAYNVLHQLTGAKLTADLRELLTLGLIEQVHRNEQSWLNVRFNQVDGTIPEFYKFASLDEEMDALGRHLEHLIANEDVSPCDICVIYNGGLAQELLLASLKPRLAKLDVEVSLQKNQPFQWRENTLVITTPHSFKGYEAEVVIIPCADQYISGENQILANNLYVAMTRARSLLAIYSLDRSDAAAKKLNDAVEACVQNLRTHPLLSAPPSQQDDFHDVLERIGLEHRAWLLGIWRESKITQEPIFDSSGSLITEPEFSFEKNNIKYACFASLEIDPMTREQLARAGIQVCFPGEPT